MPDLDDFQGLLHWERLDAWLEACPDLPGRGPVTAVERLAGGSQNNIFLLQRGGERLVLRRPPKHLRENSNQTMLREARVLAALAKSDVPHPRFLSVCEDTEVIGAAFYLMEPIDGFTPGGELPGRYASDADWRERMAFELVEGAARLGMVDHRSVGLDSFGKLDGWLERQVGRWRSQLEGYARMEGYGGCEIPGVDRVGAWLEANRPREMRPGIIHGDLQWANVMFENGAPRLAAIIDWELSTLGDPLLDLGWILTSWREPGDPEGSPSYVQPWRDFPSRDALVSRYAEITGRDVSAMPWFFALACYKLAILLEGTHARACAGKAPKEIGDGLHSYAEWLFRKAQQLIA